MGFSQWDTYLKTNHSGNFLCNSFDDIAPEERRLDRMSDMLFLSSPDFPAKGRKIRGAQKKEDANIATKLCSYLE